MTMNLINGYSLDTAIALLGPADFANYLPQSTAQHLLNIITDIAITVLRWVNYIFVDRKWYDNQTARQMIVTYINEEQSLNLDNDVHKKIAWLFEELHFRRLDSADISCADGLKDLAREKGIEFLSHDLSDVLDFGQLPPKDQYSLRNGVIRKFSMGNLTLFKSYDHYNSLSTGLANSINRILKDAELKIRRHQLFLDSNPEVAQKKYLRSIEVLLNKNGAIRASFPKGYKNDGSLIQTPLSTISIDDFEFDNDYKVLKDPLELFKIATLRSLEELGFKDRFIEYSKTSFCFDNDNQLMQKSFLSSFINFFTKREITNEEADIISLFVIIELLDHAIIDYSDCHHKVYFTPYISTSYQKPYLSMIVNESSNFPFLIYQNDLFTSQDVGCDPEAALVWLNKVKERDGLLAFKETIKKLKTSSFSAENKCAYDLIRTMATQFKIRYLEGVRDLIVDEQFKSTYLNFSSAVKNTKSSYAFFRNAFIVTAQKYASQGLFAQDDFLSGQISRIESFLAKVVVLETFFMAKAQDDFCLKVNDHVTLKFGKFFSFEFDEYKSFLSCKERSQENELFKDDEDFQASLDPIYIAEIFKRFQENPELSTEIVYLRQYLLYDLEVAFHKQREEGLEQILNPLLDLSEMEFKRKNIQFQFRKLSKQSRDLLKELRFGIFSMASNLVLNFFKPKFMAQEIYNNVEFKEDVVPTISKDYFLDLTKLDIREKKEVDLEFIPLNLRPMISIKRRRERIVPLQTIYRVSSFEASSKPRQALLKQNNVLDNYSSCGNCGYGALAMEIFESYTHSFNIDNVSEKLRNITADYIQSNSDIYLEYMLRSGEIFSPNMTTRLKQRLESYCYNLKFQGSRNWISEFEFQAIARLFGVRIEIINLSLPLKVGQNGINEGVILPNLCFGSTYTGAPIRLVFKNDNHFEVLKIKDL